MLVKKTKITEEAVRKENEGNYMENFAGILALFDMVFCFANEVDIKWLEDEQMEEIAGKSFMVIEELIELKKTMELILHTDTIKKKIEEKLQAIRDKEDSEAFARKMNKKHPFPYVNGMPT